MSDFVHMVTDKQGPWIVLLVRSPLVISEDGDTRKAG
jgi:hypothetical protein